MVGENSPSRTIDVGFRAVEVIFSSALSSCNDPLTLRTRSEESKSSMQDVHVDQSDYEVAKERGGLRSIRSPCNASSVSEIGTRLGRASQQVYDS
jgi:hypothetical protein